MGELIAIKGNKYGLNVQMDPETGFDSLYEAFIEKLEQGRRFFGSSSISIQFDGRVLSSEEQERMVEAIGAHTDMTVFCVVDPDMAVAAPKDFEQALVKAEAFDTEKAKKAEEEAMAAAEEARLAAEVTAVLPIASAVFHQGTLRSGQELNVETGIVIVGDVNPGAKVIAKGNIFVIGQLRGFAHAGFNGSDNACIFALNMAPTQMRIGRVIARSPDKFDEDTPIPQIAFLEENRIIIDSIDRTFYNSFNMLK